MADTDGKQGQAGRDLQESQSGGESGEFGGNMQQQQAAGMVGGGPGAGDASPAGGSSGTGGYGKSQNAQLHQGQGSSPPGLAGGAPHGHGGLSRGEAYDEQQGGGRGADSVSGEDGDGADDFLVDQRAHQDRGQSEAERESD